MINKHFSPVITLTWGMRYPVKPFRDQLRSLYWVPIRENGLQLMRGVHGLNRL